MCGKEHHWLHLWERESWLVTAVVIGWAWGSSWLWVWVRMLSLAVAEGWMSLAVAEGWMSLAVAKVWMSLAVAEGWMSLAVAEGWMSVTNSLDGLFRNQTGIWEDWCGGAEQTERTQNSWREREVLKPFINRLKTI